MTVGTGDVPTPNTLLVDDGEYMKLAGGNGIGGGITGTDGVGANTGSIGLKGPIKSIYETGSLKSLRPLTS